MVDTQTIEHSVAQQLEDEAVRMIKQLGQFHAQAGELVDVEKAPIINVVGGNAKMGGAPVLILDQFVQLAPCPQPPRLAIQAVGRSLDRLSHVIAVAR